MGGNYALKCRAVCSKRSEYTILTKLFSKVKIVVNFFNIIISLVCPFDNNCMIRHQAICMQYTSILLKSTL